jgi:threonyl-tRNA synthetase
MQHDIAHIRHSLAHILAIAALKHDPAAKLSVGPATENGFYYDVLFSENKAPTLEDLAALEKTMRHTLKQNLSFTREEVTHAQAKEHFTGNPFKLAIIEDKEREGVPVTFYHTGDFTDLCAGGHVENTNEIDPQSFALTNIAGAYWRGDEKNPMLTRIYGIAFENKAALDEYQAKLEEAKKRDHRKLGAELDLFCFDEEIGKGLPIWLPKGNIIKEELENWAKETEEKWGYQRVTTPVLTKENLFYTSGHLPHYKDSMYAPLEIEGENYYIKPMNCPFHHKVFSARPRSYRELPLRLAEYGWCHRYEDSGSLFGLMRVRGMQMNDAHLYVTEEQMVDEFVKVIQLHEHYYKILGITEYQMELALRDPNNMEKYHGDESDWQKAETVTREAMEKSGVPYVVVDEGAAFYGPKMDFQIYSSIGRSFTASTNQLDLYMGKKFNLEYTTADGSKKTPAIIHRAPLGTHERFIGFLIEHFAGAFPLWLSPVQIVVLPVSEKFTEGAEQMAKILKEDGIRVEVDQDNDSLGKRLRNAKTHKVPYILVVGEKEIESGNLTLEGRGDEKVPCRSIHEALEFLQKKIRDRSL